MSRLFYEEFRIEVGGEDITLRPTLRAATLVLARYGDLTTAFRSLTELNVTVMADLLRTGSGQRLPHIHFALCDRLNDLGPVVDALSAFLAALSGAGAANDNADAKPKPTAKKRKKAKPLTLAEYHAKLFSLATGAIGWAPADAWEATPAEIEAAYAGRCTLIGDILKAALGSGDGKREYDPLDTERDEDGFAELRMMAGATGAGVR